MTETSAPRHDHEPVRRGLTTRNRRRARSSRELTSLFETRAELRGINPTADYFVEAVRWNA